MPFGVAVGAMVAGTAMSAYGQYQAGKAEQEWREYNAAILGQEAKATKEAAIYEEKEHRKAGERYKARMRAMYGKSALSLEPGMTPFLMLEETAGEIEKDALMIRRGGEIGEQRLISQAGLERKKGRYARRAGRWGAGATLMSGAGQVTDLYGRKKGYW